MAMKIPRAESSGWPSLARKCSTSVEMAGCVKQVIILQYCSINHCRRNLYSEETQIFRVKNAQKNVKNCHDLGLLSTLGFRE